MASTFLSTTQRHQLSHLPHDIPEDDLGRYFTLSAADLELIRQRRSPHNQLGFALQLCTLRYVGFVPDELNNPPLIIANLLAYQLGLFADTVAAYPQRKQTKSEHLASIMVYVGFRRATPADLQTLESWLINRALEHDKPTFLLQLAAEQLRWERILRPGLTILEKLVSRVRQQAREITYQQLTHLLTSENKFFLDQTLVVGKGNPRTTLSWLQQMPTDFTATQINATLHKIRYLQQFDATTWDVTAVNPNRLKYLANIGNRASNQQLQRTSELKRYPIVIAFLKQALSDLIDVVIDLFDASLWKYRQAAKAELDELRLQAASQTNEILREYMQVLQIVVDDTIEDVRPAIFATHRKLELEQLITTTARLIRPKHDEAIDLFANRYHSIRRYCVHFLKTLTFHAQDSVQALMQGIDLLDKLNRGERQRLSSKTPIGFITKAWHPYLFDQHGRINRHYYELAVLWELRLALRSGDVFVAHSRRYADPNSYLIPPDQWENQRSELIRITQTPPNGVTRIHQRERQLQQLAQQVETHFDSGHWLRSKAGRWILTAYEGEGRPESAQRLEEEIVARLPRIDMTDLLLEVSGWTKISDHFQHALTHSPPTDNIGLIYLHAALLAQGCNFTLTQMARSGQLQRHRLIYTNTWFIRDETLQAANTALVNYHHHLDISDLWGMGTFSSSDGQRFPVTGRHLKARTILRYFGYRRGITFYTWTSDQFSQYGSKAISSTIRDSTYVLDEILANETELPILEHTTDTNGYTEIVFALFDLLGLAFTPRIRDIASIQLYRTPNLALDTLSNVKKRLAKNIRIDLILDNWDEMLRLAGSLKFGWVTASLILQKIQAAARKSRLALALQEYGRLIKTIHALGWYASVEKRRWTNRQLNKGEALHALRAHLMFANRGTIQRKSDEALNHQAGCLSLLTNSVILWNSIYMAEVLEQLEREQIPFNPDDIRHIWPTRFEHINVHGKYEFNLEQARQLVGLRPLRHPHSLHP